MTKAVGASVSPLHAVGRGVPDLLVGFRGKRHTVTGGRFTSSVLLTGQLRRSLLFLSFLSL